MIALALALSLPQAQGESPPASSRLTVAEWSRQDERQRQILVVAAVEGLLLAASGPQGETSGVDARCLSDARLADVSSRVAEQAGASPFVLAVMEASGCSR